VAREHAQPKEWADGEAEADLARERVATQLAELLCGQGMTGSEASLSRRLAEMVEARRYGDRVALRAAVMEVSVAAAAYAVTLDLDGPSLRRGE
jgi:hypothetical protein